MGRTSERQREISMSLSLVVTVALGVAMVYLGVMLARFGLYAVNEGEDLVGLLGLVFGLVFVGGPVAVLIGQIRAMLRRRD